MVNPISDESAQRLREIMAKLGVKLTLEDALEYGEWLLDVYEILTQDKGNNESSQMSGIY